MSDSKPEDIQHLLEKIIREKTVENSTLKTLLGKLSGKDSSEESSGGMEEMEEPDDHDNPTQDI
jgi:hypothetical protein